MKKHSPYSKFEKDELILRDELALDRTFLANERTLLAYLRSGVALVIAGISILHFSEVRWYRLAGVFCVPLGLFAALFGCLRYRKMQNTISIVRKKVLRAQASRPTPSEP